MAPPLFSAVTSSVRQLLMLLRCISFSKKTQVRITSEGLRFSCEEGSSLEASIFLEKSLFTTYSYNARGQLSSDAVQEQDAPLFEVSLFALLETLNIFSLSDASASRRPGADYDGFAAHRLNRHAGMDAFSNRALGVSGTCTLSYDGIGTALSVHMSESGVTTTCDLTTYEAESFEDIPFNRESLALKTIMRASYLFDAVNELSTMSPTEFTVQAKPADEDGPDISFSAAGTIGSATIDFTTQTPSETPVLETFQCPRRVSATFGFAVLKAAHRAMAVASKISIRVDDEGVLSMQFLVDLGSGANAFDTVAFVDFRAIPLADTDSDGESSSSTP